jgi:hypothetical protein
VTTAREHFLFARERALEYVEMGDAGNAMTSMVSDLGKHPGTADILTPDLTALFMGEVLIGGVTGARRFIEGLPIPKEDTPAGRIARIKKGDRLAYVGEYAPEVVTRYGEGIVTGFREHGTKVTVELVDQPGHFADWPVDEVEAR